MSATNSTMSSQIPNYDFVVSKPAAVAFSAIFGILLVAHVGEAAYYRTLWIWPLLIGLILETSGFAMRDYSIIKMFTEWPAIIAQVNLIVAPAFIAAQNYMMVGRMISWLGKEHSIVSHTLITKIFVVGDIISIFSQAAGGSVLNSTDLKTIRVGFNILIGALAFQVIMFCIFVVITVAFDIRTRRALGKQRAPIQPLFWAFYVSASMIILRSIYRTFEFATVKFTPNNASGYTLNHEWLLYAWDAVPITISAATLCIVPAGHFLPRAKGVRIDGTVEPPRPSRVCCCCCIYKRPRPHKYVTEDGKLNYTVKMV